MLGYETLMKCVKERYDMNKQGEWEMGVKE